MLIWMVGDSKTLSIKGMCWRDVLGFVTVKARIMASNKTCYRFLHNHHGPDLSLA